MGKAHYVLLGLFVLMLISCDISKGREDGGTSNQDLALPQNGNGHSGDIAVSSEDLPIDSDGDFISDSLEKKIGTDPNVADFPRIFISQVNFLESGGRVKKEERGVLNSYPLLLTQRYENPIDLESKYGHIRNKVLRLQFKKIIDPQYLPSDDELATQYDDDLFLVGNWSDSQFFPFLEKLMNDGMEHVGESGRITSIFKVGFKDIVNITEITNELIGSDK